MQPNLKRFMQFWNRPQPFDVSTADWYADLLEPVSGDPAPAADIEDANLATTGLFGRSKVEGLEANAPSPASPFEEPALPVICEIPIQGGSSLNAQAQIGSERPVEAGETWMPRPPAAWVLAAGEDGGDLARIQPAGRSPMWWEAGCRGSSALTIEKVERVRAAIAPITWHTVHEELALQLATAPDFALGEQIPASAWNPSLPPASTMDPALLVRDLQDDAQVVTGCLRRAFG